MAMDLNFDSFVSSLHSTLNKLPDYRKPNNNMKYTIKDAALGAFSIFFTQSPSFLAYQNILKQAKGKSNAETLFGIKHILSDNQIRNLLDPVEPGCLFPVFHEIYEGLEDSGILKQFETPDNNLLVIFDGTQYFSSNKIHCDQCSHKTIKDKITYFHQVVTPVIALAGKSEVIALEPEFILPQDGHEKQDCELAAAKRWIIRNAERYLRPITILGDDLYCHQPFCQLILSSGWDFILVCKAESHKILYEWIEELEAMEALETLVERKWNGRFHEIYTYRYFNQVPLRDGEDALKVNWCELSITNSKTGKNIYKNAFIVNSSIDHHNVKSIIRDGRTRWKVENENNNILKTKGYHLEHNYGHGKQYLSMVLLTLNLMAFLFHTLLNLIDQQYQLLRKTLGARKTFFNDIRALTRYFVFESWNNLMNFMIQGLELEPPDSR